MSESTAKKQKVSNDVVLYSYWRSSCSWRVRFALDLKGIKYDYKPIHLVKNGGEQFSEEYCKINPNNRVPLLDHNDTIISQSQAIIEYLEEQFPTGKKLLPETAKDRAKVREICGIIGSDIQPIQNLSVLKRVMTFGEDEEKDKIKMQWGKEWIARGFKSLEKILKSSAGKYCVGDEISMADVFLAPQVYNALRFKVSMDEFPTINRVNNALKDVPEYKSSDPSAMPDAM